MVLVLGASGDSPHSKASEPEVAGATPDTRRHTTPKAKRIVSMVDVWVASCVRLPHRQPPASVELDGSVSLYLLIFTVYVSIFRVERSSRSQAPERNMTNAIERMRTGGDELTSWLTSDLRGRAQRTRQALRRTERVYRHSREFKSANQHTPLGSWYTAASA